MKKRLLAVVAAVSFSLIPLPALASSECPDPARPIHYLPYCFSESELQAYVANQTQTVSPTPVLVAPVDLVRQLAYYYWPDWAAERMIRIAACESGYDPAARNVSSGAAGLWQIMPFWQRTWPGDYYDPWTNAAVAYQIWLVQGFGAWVCRG